MGILYTIGIMAYLAAVILGLYKIAPSWMKEDIQKIINK